MQLRYYQENAINYTFDWLQNNEGNPLVVLPTGTGKSLVVAKVGEIVTQHQDARVLCAIHTEELVEQNYLEFCEIMPFMDTGVYCAGLKRKEKDSRVVFGSIQSMYKKAYQIGRIDVLIVDEAHTISRNDETRWGQFIGDLLTINPDMRVIGLTATPYRLDSGNLIGENTLFTAISYEYPLLDAIRDGYLCEVVPKGMAAKFDLSGVGKRGGEYVQSELENAVNVDAVTVAALDEVEQFGVGRRSWLIFASGTKHAHAIHAELQRRGYKGAVIDKDTPKDERREAIRTFKNYELRYLVNFKVLTTGFNHKGVDLIVDMNPTQSAGLHVQKVGRGTRPLYADGMPMDTPQQRIDAIAASQKPNCLLLDFAGNCETHGALDKIKGKDKEQTEGGGIPPMKECPQCATIVYAGVRVCNGYKLDNTLCLYKFPENAPDIRSFAANIPVLSTQEIIEEWTVDAVSYKLHQKKDKPLPTMQVTYTCNAGTARVREWICFEHTGRARQKAVEWWVKRCHIEGFPCPVNVQEAVELVSGDDSFGKPSRLIVSVSGKFPELRDCIFETKDEQLPLGNQSESYIGEIPF